MSAIAKVTSTNCSAQPHDLGTHFIVRSCVDRLAGEGDHTIADAMAEVPVAGRHAVEVRDGKGRIETVALELRYRRIRVLPPIGKQKRYLPLELTIIKAQECDDQRDEPTGRARIDWQLITNLPVDGTEHAIEKLRWYALRWKIEVFHKILKSGCRAEQARLRTAERLVNLIAVYCIVSWRIFWMTMMNRASSQATPLIVLTATEIALLDQLVPDSVRSPRGERSLAAYIVKIARLGGYLARTGDPPPGNIVMWRGLSRLTDIALGASLAARTGDVGN
jgi:DDE family transposase